jgi:hypothetical protein
MQKGFANHLNRFQYTKQEMYRATFNVQRSSYVYTYHSYFIYACMSVCAVVAVLIFWDWSIHSWYKDEWLSKDSTWQWWKPNNRGKIEWITAFSLLPFPLHFKQWSWTVLAACLPVWPIHVAKCQCWSNISPTENVVCPSKRCNWNMTAILWMLKHNVHIIDVAQTTSLCNCLPPTIETWQAHTLFRCLNR